jgi:hypothetical protein
MDKIGNPVSQFTTFISSGAGREKIGIPYNWSTVSKWLNPGTKVLFPPSPSIKTQSKKCPDVPVLKSYVTPPPPAFWKAFPSLKLPSHPTSALNYQRLGAIIKGYRSSLSLDQFIRSDRVLKDLEHGSAAPFLNVLPSARTPNTPSVSIHGEEFTDTLAWWIRQGYVAGPFAAPPFKDFRTNAMMAVEQKNKIRIIMNMSAPKGSSYNDAIDEMALEKVSMSSARLFGYSVQDCGTGARMWKFDMVDAYKTIPTPTSELRLQGFSWLGKFFVELKKVFGSKEAVSAFDRLNNTLVTLAALAAHLPPHLIHRTLDDVPVVTPASSPAGPAFAEAYQDLCQHIGAALAPPCPDFEKAFCDSTHGTILGIQFNTVTLTWSISREKRSRILDRIRGPLTGHPISLLDLQKLIGTLNDVGQMCPFLRGFRQPLHLLLVEFQEDSDILLPIPQQVKNDLRVWAAAMDTVVTGLPIPRRPSQHLPSALFFASDASGAQFNKHQGRFITIPYEGDRGAASINTIEDNILWFYATITFPKSFLLEKRDSSDHAFGCKSSTLEAVGLILPFLCCPSLLIGREVTLLTDNEALVYGWDKRRVPHDTSASIFIRAIHIISAFLGTSVEVRHLPRISTPSAELVDALTRSTTTLKIHKEAVNHIQPAAIPAALTNWFNDPKDDWNLPLYLLEYVRSII